METSSRIDDRVRVMFLGLGLGLDKRVRVRVWRLGLGLMFDLVRATFTLLSVVG